MRENIFTTAMIMIFIAGLFVCDTIFAGPAMNAQQFQQKAVNSALKKDSGSQNYRPKQEYVEWTSSPVSTPSDTTGKTNNPVRIGDRDKTSSVVK